MQKFYRNTVAAEDSAKLNYAYYLYINNEFTLFLPSKINQFNQMQIIQSIRDKGAAIIIIVIALSLIGFILMDSRTGSNNASRSLSTKIGKVNGENIELKEMNKRVMQLEAQEQQRTGQKPNSAGTNRIREQVWNQLVAESIFFKEAEKLGISFTSKELSAILLSNDQSNPFLQQQGMIDPTTGKLDLMKAQDALVNIKKAKAEQREAVDAQIIDPLKLTSIAGKYSGLIAASAYYPTWMQEKEISEANSFASINYVAVPYSEISDSSVKVTDTDINEYVSKHKGLFKQEAGRKISYVAFSQLPTAEDSLKVRNQLNELKSAFANDTNAKAFVARNTSVISFNDAFLPKSKIPSSQLDTILRFPQGSVYGPYPDQSGLLLAKVLATKELPDSVRARHILIPTNDPQTGQPLMADSVAKKLADSILAAIKGGADFGALALKYSSDGSKDKGGDLGTFGYGTMVGEFNDFTFNKPVGTKDVVRTQFGYHVIDILSQTSFKPAYKIAFLAKAVDPSETTINNASNEATRASASKSPAELATYAKQQGVMITHVPNIIKENDFAVGETLTDARPLIKWAFDAKQGAVSEPFSIGDHFIVATVDKIEKEGTQDASTARSGAEAIIAKQKKAVIIKAKLGTKPTLESAAAAYGKQVSTSGADSTLSFSAQMINGLGVEPKLIGAAFNKDYQTKVSAPIEGTNAVYVLKVNSIQTKAADAADVAAQKRATRMAGLRNQTNNWFEGLRKQADIKDKRSESF